MSVPEERTVRQRFDRLEGRIGSLEQQVKRQSEASADGGDIEEQVASLEERVDMLKENQEAIVGNLRKVADFLEETREEVGLGGFWENDQT